jgi:transaldolase
MNLLQALRHHGQSVWLDGLERNSILTGQLQHLISNGLRGLLSNFTRLELAILAGEYDRDFQSIASRSNLDLASIYEYLIIQDIQLAADLMKAVYDRTHATDGFVNLDLPPQLAIDTQATLTEARRLWQAVGWSNLMLKIPATAATIPAIAPLIAEGINVNVTLLCSQIVYERVAEAYLRGLEALLVEGKEVSKVASVASFSIGCLDEAVAKLKTTAPQQALQESLLGHVGIAQAKVVYQRYQAIYQTDRWQSLARLGAQPQRLLWDLTNIDSARFPAQHYIESLVGAGTVLALSPQIIENYDRFSPTQASLTVDVDLARQTLEHLEQIMSLETIAVDVASPLANRLLTEELQRSQDAYQQLSSTIEQKYNQEKSRSSNN